MAESGEGEKLGEGGRLELREKEGGTVGDLAG